MQCARHLHCERALAGQHLGYLGTAAHERDKITRRKPALLHAKPDCSKRARKTHGDMLRLVKFDKVSKNIEFLTLRGTTLGVHKGIDTRDSGLVICLASNCSNIAHLTPPRRRSLHILHACRLYALKPSGTDSYSSQRACNHTYRSF